MAAAHGTVESGRSGPVVALDQKAPEVAAAIHSVMQAAYRVEAALLGVADFVPLRRTPEAIASTDARFLGMRADGVLAAVIELADEGPTHRQIDALVVSPDRFRTGLATALLHEVIAMEPSGELKVSTAALNAPALDLYRSCGFSELDRWTTPDGIAMVTLGRRADSGGTGPRPDDGARTARPPRITTARLVLTPLERADAPRLFEYCSDPEVARYQTWEPATLDDAVAFIRELEPIAFDTPGTWFQLGIRLKDSNLLVGDLGVHFSEEEPRAVEVGVTLAPEQQGHGYATEAVRGLLGRLFGELGKHRVTASIDPRNDRSLALFERVGMRHEGHFRESLWFKGEWVDDVVFAMLESEWSD